MYDNQLISLIISIIDSQKANAGISAVDIVQAFQPTQQGVASNPTAYIHKIGDKRYGFPRMDSVWNVESGTMVETTTEQYETTFQISALSTQDPANVSQLTASDILNSIAYILQNTITVAQLEAQGVGILRIGEVRNPYFINDRDRHEASPNFDFVLTHKQIITSAMPIIAENEINIYSV